MIVGELLRAFARALSGAGRATLAANNHSMVNQRLTTETERFAAIRRGGNSGLKAWWPCRHGESPNLSFKPIALGGT